MEKTKRRKGVYHKKEAIALVSMLVPGLVYLIINNYIPMAGIIIAFKKYDFSKGILGSEWYGFRNFTFLFRTQDAFYIIRNTVLYNIVFIILGNILAITIAIMLNELKGKKRKKTYQTLIVIPYLISMVVVSYIVYAFLSLDSGFINHIVRQMGGQPIQWYTESKYWPFILTIVYLWKTFGYVSIIFYSTVIGIDSAIYEAAAIDGAGRLKRIWHVTLPGLKNTIITMVLLSVGKMFYSDFGLFYQVPQRSGLIANVTDTIDVYVYKSLTRLNDIGRSSAAGLLQSVLGFVLVLVVNMIVRKIDDDSALF